MTEKNKKALQAFLKTARAYAAWALLGFLVGGALYTGARLAEHIWPHPAGEVVHMLQGPAQ